MKWKMLSELYTSEKKWNELFFLLITIATLGSMFYVSKDYNDPFFTSGMLWMGYVVTIGWIVWLLKNKQSIRIPRIMIYWSVILLIYAGVSLWEGSFSQQNFVFLLTLYGVMWLFAQEKKGANEIYICTCIASIGAVEALWGIGQWLGLINRYNLLFSITGSFDNPAGYAIALAACLPFTLHTTYKLKRYGQIYAIIMVMVTIGGILLSGSRTGIVAMGTALTISLLHHIPWNKRIKRQLFIGSIAVGIFVIIVLYFVRKDSADGRLLVWRCTWELIKEKPLTGHGAGSFGGQYMPAQAHYLSEHPNKRHNWLAENIKHPFNEYLKLWVEYGAIGLIIILLGIIKTLKQEQKENEICFVARLGIITIGVCGLFSYPLNYPSICCLLAMNGGLLTSNKMRRDINNNWVKLIGIPTSIVLFTFVSYWQRMEQRWYQTSQLALKETMEVLPIYKQLYVFMRKNPLFLYNYGAELHVRGLWKEAATKLESCAHQLNDSDVQLLLAECYIGMGDAQRAEACLILASQMFPNLFIPEYRLVELYRSLGRENEAIKMAKRLLGKPVKVRSYVIEKIQKEMNEYLSSVYKNKQLNY